MTTACITVATGDTLLLPCAGPCNVGQLSLQAAVALTDRGFGRVFALAGIAAGIESFVSEARSSKVLVAIDGCSTACTRRIIEQNGIACRNHLVITDLGIDRDATLHPGQEQLELVVDAVQACCAEARPIVRLGGCMCGI
jgi:uncharacterized metal-binding protein